MAAAGVHAMDVEGLGHVSLMDVSHRARCLPLWPLAPIELNLGCRL
jgi:hypothetical protein